MSEGKTALVLGATGLVGQSLIEQLTQDQRYTRITCLVRNLPDTAASLDKKIQFIEIDFKQAQPLQNNDRFFAVDHVYVCLGTTIKQAGSKSAFRKVDYDLVLEAAKVAGRHAVDSFVWISSIGANAKSSSFYLKVKGELEDAIMALPNLPVATAIRPSLLLGDRNESRPAEKAGIVLANGLSFLLIGPLKKYRPIDASDVAKQMINNQSWK